MRTFRSLTACVATLYLALPAAAWGATGHRIIAAIAYDRLAPNTRSRVDALIQAHPDYAAFTRGAPEDAAGRARAAFIAASVWPDTIKGDPRFYDDTKKDAQPTPALPGFPDMQRHTNWHYYDTPYTPDGAHGKKAREPNALTEMRRLLKEIGAEAPDLAAYDLPWIEHITGDLGEPLHCVTRMLRSMPEGDDGGNRVFVTPGRNLHSLWDDAADAPDRGYGDRYVSKYEAAATAAHPVGPKNETNPKKWIQEGYEVSRTQVYTFGLETGSREHPFPLPAAYVENARRVAEGQIALAGYRLAAVLNDRLR